MDHELDPDAPARDRILDAAEGLFAEHGFDATPTSRIAERAEPLSTRTIPSGEPVLSVLEINAGIAEKLGIKPGDKVEHPLFKR